MCALLLLLLLLLLPLPLLLFFCFVVVVPTSKVHKDRYINMTTPTKTFLSSDPERVFILWTFGPWQNHSTTYSCWCLEGSEVYRTGRWNRNQGPRWSEPVKAHPWGVNWLDHFRDSSGDAGCIHIWPHSTVHHWWQWGATATWPTWKLELAVPCWVWTGLFFVWGHGGVFYTMLLLFYIYNLFVDYNVERRLDWLIMISSYLAGLWLDGDFLKGTI